MNEVTTSQNAVIRTGRGLTIAGTRITLYSIMDYLKADWPPALIKELFDLTDGQMVDVQAYLEAHRNEVEAEYRLVLQKAAENQRYWMERNREHMERIAAMPHKPENEEVWKKLKSKIVNGHSFGELRTKSERSLRSEESLRNAESYGIPRRRLLGMTWDFGSTESV
jgi:uncharacterized protein (DUF433 family)